MKISFAGKIWGYLLGFTWLVLGSFIYCSVSFADPTLQDITNPPSDPCKGVTIAVLANIVEGKCPSCTIQKILDGSNCLDGLLNSTATLASLENQQMSRNFDGTAEAKDLQKKNLPSDQSAVVKGNVTNIASGISMYISEILVAAQASAASSGSTTIDIGVSSSDGPALNIHLQELCSQNQDINLLQTLISTLTPLYQENNNNPSPPSGTPPGGTPQNSANDQFQKTKALVDQAQKGNTSQLDELKGQIQQAGGNAGVVDSALTGNCGFNGDAQYLLQKLSPLLPMLTFLQDTKVLNFLAFSIPDGEEGYQHPEKYQISIRCDPSGDQTLSPDSSCFSPDKNSKPESCQCKSDSPFAKEIKSEAFQSVFRLLVSQFNLGCIDGDEPKCTFKKDIINHQFGSTGDQQSIQSLAGTLLHLLDKPQKQENPSSPDPSGGNSSGNPPAQGTPSNPQNEDINGEIMQILTPTVSRCVSQVTAGQAPTADCLDAKAGALAVIQLIASKLGLYFSPPQPTSQPQSPSNK